MAVQPEVDVVALGRVYMDWHAVPAAHLACVQHLAGQGLVELRVRLGGGYDARLSFAGRRYMAAAAHELE